MAAMHVVSMSSGLLSTKPFLRFCSLLMLGTVLIPLADAQTPPAPDADALGSLLSELGGAESAEFPCCEADCKLARCQMEQGACPPGLSCYCDCAGWAAVCTCIRRWEDLV
jgi:hypothetical protein